MYSKETRKELFSEFLQDTTNELEYTYDVLSFYNELDETGVEDAINLVNDLQDALDKILRKLENKEN